MPPMRQLSVTTCRLQRRYAYAADAASAMPPAIFRYYAASCSPPRHAAAAIAAISDATCFITAHITPYALRRQRCRHYLRHIAAAARRTLSICCHKNIYFRYVITPNIFIASLRCTNITHYHYADATLAADYYFFIFIAAISHYAILPLGRDINIINIINTPLFTENTPSLFAAPLCIMCRRRIIDAMPIMPLFTPWLRHLRRAVTSINITAFLADHHHAIFDCLRRHGFITPAAVPMMPLCD